MNETIREGTMSTDKNRGRLDRLKAEVKAYNTTAKATWGEVSTGLLARYIAGECNADENDQVEQAASKFPAVREAIDVVTAALNDAGPEDAAEHRSAIQGTKPHNSKETPEARINRRDNRRTER
jgi:hypothetical protein